MKLIVCLDERGGMMFNSRRQSSDSLLRERILKMLDTPEHIGARLVLSPYSARQFTQSEKILISSKPKEDAGEQDFYFAEDLEYSTEDCSQLIIYRWNRHYPSDKYFNSDIKKEGFSLLSAKDFEGSSHKKITEEIYTK